MAKYALEGAVQTTSPDGPATSSVAFYDDLTGRHKDHIDAVRHELDGYYGEMKDFAGCEPDEIFMKLAGWSARASEIRSQLVRQEGRRAQALRTREVEPFLDEIDRQFRLHSRVQAVREWD